MSLVLLIPASSTSREIIIGVVSAVVGGFVLSAIPWLRDTILIRSVWFLRWVQVFVTASRFVLVWNDAGPNYAKSLISKMPRDLTRKYRFACIASPESLPRYPRRRTAAVVLIDTDVTKLAGSQKVADKVEAWLKKHVEKGGALVGTHDVLWRRVRATQLHGVMGGQLKHFDLRDGGDVSYQLCSDQTDHQLRQHLQPSFTLSDGEVCYGDWKNDVQVIYATADAAKRPLVVARDYPKGRCVWLNSGDHGEPDVATSVGEPQKEFVQLVINAVRWGTKTKPK